MIRVILSMFVLLACAALAQANPPYAVRVQRVQFVQPVYAAPIVQQVESYCQPAQFAAPVIQQVYQPQAFAVQSVYSQPVLQVQQYGYAQSVLQVRGHSQVLGIGGIVRRQGILERLGNRQADRRDAAAIRQVQRSQAIILR